MSKYVLTLADAESVFMSYSKPRTKALPKSQAQPATLKLLIKATLKTRLRPAKVKLLIKATWRSRLRSATLKLLIKAISKSRLRPATVKLLIKASWKNRLQPVTLRLSLQRLAGIMSISPSFHHHRRKTQTWNSRHKHFLG